MEFPIYVYSLPNHKESPKYVMDMFVDLYFLFVACRWTLSVHFAVPKSASPGCAKWSEVVFPVLQPVVVQLRMPQPSKSIPLANFEASRLSLFSICSLN